jgi:hypothetical protein
LLRRWGEGANLLRGQWRPRDNNDEDEDEDDGSSLPPSSALPSDDSDGPDDDEGVDAVASASAFAAVNGDRKAEPEKMSEDNAGDDAVDALTHDVSALGLVPSSVRFGRGGSARGRAGLAKRNGRPAARHLGHASHPAQPQAATITAAVGEASEGNENEKEKVEDSDAMEQDLVVASDKPPARGRRGRGRAGGGGGGGGGGAGGRGIGRGRGGFVPPPPRAGFLARGGAGHARGLPRGLIVNAMRARGRGGLT